MFIFLCRQSFEAGFPQSILQRENKSWEQVASLMHSELNFKSSGEGGGLVVKVPYLASIRVRVWIHICELWV